MEPNMASGKKATGGKAARDQHKSAFMVRLPEEFRETFKEIKAKTGQPYTEAVRRAMIDYAVKHGIQPPATST